MIYERFLSGLRLFITSPGGPRQRRTTANRAVAPLLWGSIFGFLLVGTMVNPAAHAASRIKDIANFEGIRDNLLVGYGLVVGLNGTGDSLTNAVFTKQSLVGMLERLGVNTRDESITTENVAAVMVSATLPSFSRQGTRIDVSVSAMGDADSLQGGTLLVTPLIGADGEVYAVGQGQVAIGGFSASGNAGTVTKGVPTNGRIANGAIVERELNFQMASLESVQITLRNPDLTTVRRVANRINTHLRSSAAIAADPGTVNVKIPKDYPGGVVSLLTNTVNSPVMLPAPVPGPARSISLGISANTVGV